MACVGLCGCLLRAGLGHRAGGGRGDALWHLWGAVGRDRRVRSTVHPHLCLLWGARAHRLCV